MDICCLSRLRLCCLILFSTLKYFIFCLWMQYIQSRLDDAQPQKLDDAQPQQLDDAQPQQLDDAQPQQLDDAQPQQLDDAQPQQLDDAKPQQLDDAQPQQLDNSTNSNDDEDDLFFSSRRKRNSFATDHLDQYLAAGVVGHHIHLSSLNTWPQLKSLFVKLNTPLAASAACERLFSVAGLIFTPRLACLSDTTFENQLLPRLNKAFV